MSLETGALAIDSFSHIGVVVEDIDKTTKFLSSILDLGPWDIREYSPTKDELMIGELFGLKEAHANIRGTEVELIQPLAGNSIWSQFLETNGEGIHHISFTVSNWEESVSKFQERGGRMVAGATFDGKRWSYFATKPGGMIIELEEK